MTGEAPPLTWPPRAASSTSPLTPLGLIAWRTVLVSVVAVLPIRGPWVLATAVLVPLTRFCLVHRPRQRSRRPEGLAGLFGVAGLVGAASRARRAGHRLTRMRTRKNPGEQHRPCAPSGPGSATVTASAAMPGPDGRLRCPWGLAPAEYLAYHDDEWGRPVRDDQGIFERLCLEAFQSGLSWLTILRKRAGFRAAFRGFDIEAVAGFGPDDIARLLADARIIRNSAKINAAITNARVAVGMPGGLAATIWRFADPRSRVPRTAADVPASTEGSKAMARELKRLGFQFVGATTAYATMQACGLVNDHLEDCFRREEPSL
jgi:DNA-3-methyladenine glycosylase I